ncbi:MAG: sigma-54 dependent transcriptional regulator [Candidatus Polarisedimenticolaceae bacterium]|nr:sigma-54 dependent transcriptional regulator [Candidatus Polarisedimenticolaceae bacterium]
MSDMTVLIVEDDPSLREALCDTLSLAGFATKVASEGSAALKILEHNAIGLVVSDVQMRPMNGHKLLEQIKVLYPAIPVLMMSAYGTIEKAVTAMRGGAVDYLVKPFEAEALLEKVEQLVPSVQPQQQHQEMVAEDLQTRELVELARRVATSNATVLLKGASGTGKEVFARLIHNASERRDGPFVAINCAAIPEDMLEAILFGYEKGAYTGALKRTAGKFEQAQGGTLLLDEISEMSLGLQAKLLRVLQEREVERLGGSEMISLDLRVLATTNRNLREEVAAGRFREDLFYRLNVFPLTLPPLRERPRDIMPLAHFLIQRQLQPGQVAPTFSEKAIQLLLAHSWPGNIRELDNLMQRTLILNDSQIIDVSDLSFEADQITLAPPKTENEALNHGQLTDDLKSVEEQMILDALHSERGCRKDVADKLGISPRTLRYKIARMRDAGVAIPR